MHVQSVRAIALPLWPAWASAGPVQYVVVDLRRSGADSAKVLLPYVAPTVRGKTPER